MARELAQETLARVCQHWSRVQRMDAPQAWAHRVAMNLANSWFRRRKAERAAVARVGGFRQAHENRPGPRGLRHPRRATSGTEPAMAEVEDGRVLAYLADMSEHEVIYEQAQWAKDCEAEFEKADKDKGDTVYQWNVENLCVSNDSPRMRRALISPEVGVISAPEGDAPAQESLDWLDEFRAKTSDASHWTYWLTIEDGVVTRSSR